MIKGHGVLPYGSDDASVIFRRSLTVAPLAAATASGDVGACATLTPTGTPSYDATLGFKMDSAGVSDRLLITNIAGVEKLKAGGQIRFEVETALLASSDALAVGSSGGVTLSVVNCMIAWLNSVAGGNHRGALYINTSKQIGVSWPSGPAVGSAGGGVQHQFNDSYSDSYTLVVLSLSGKELRVYLDGVLTFTISRTADTAAAPMTNPFYQIILGNSGGGSQPMTAGRIRNLQISTKPVVLPIHPMLANVDTFGDSYASAIASYSEANFFNLNAGLTLAAGLRNAGYSIGTYTNDSYGGRKVIGSGAAATYLKDNIVTALAKNPTFILYQGGTNDFTVDGTLDTAAFEAAMKDHVEQFFGVNGNPATTVKGMVVNTTPWALERGGVSTVADPVAALTYQPDVLSIRDIVLALPTWFDAAYPALAGRLGAFDMYEWFGYDQSDVNSTSLFGLHSAGTVDYLHPNDKGHYKKGTGWAQGVLSLVRKFSA